PHGGLDLVEHSHSGDRLADRDVAEPQIERGGGLCAACSWLPRGRERQPGRGMKWKGAIAGSLAGGAAGGVLAEGFGRNPHEVPFMLRGQPAPTFALKTLQSGELVTLAELRGKPVVLNFWSTWCIPCRTEHSVLEWGFREYGNQARFFGAIFEDTE